MFASYKFGKCLAIVFAIGMIMILPQFISAQGASVSVNPVFTVTDPPQLVGGATSTLVRTNNGISMELTTSGLEPGAYTIWFVVFNNPDACFLGPDMCGLADEDFEVGGPAGFGFTYAAGHIVDDSGEATFAGHLKTGAALLNDDLELDEVLENARTAEIHLIVRYHGPAVPGRIPEQIRTGEFDNPNVFDLQFAVNPPPAP